MKRKKRKINHKNVRKQKSPSTVSRFHAST